MSSIPSSPAPAEPSTGRLVAIVAGVIVAIIIVTVGGLVVAGYVFASRVSVSTVTDERGREKTVRIDTPLGRLRLDADRTIDPKLLNIPLYPGAAVTEGKRGARVDLDLDFADKYLRVMAVEMETADPVEKVVEFYRQAAADFVFSANADGKVEFRWEQGRLKKVVGIVERNGKTRISLANVGEPEAN